MNALIVYNGRFGNTERAAEKISQELKKHGSEDVTIKAVLNSKKLPELLKSSVLNLFTLGKGEEPKYPPASAAEIANYDLLIFGGPNSPAQFRTDLTVFMSEVAKINLEGKKVAIFDTRYAEDQNAGADQEIANGAQKSGASIIGETLHLFIPNRKIAGPLVEGELAKVKDWVEDLVKEFKR